MPETPEELYARAAGNLRTPDVEQWDSWPFAGPVTPRPLLPPVDRERPRAGEGGVDCRRCTLPDAEYAWTDEHWRLVVLPGTGVPLIALLEPRAHYAEPGDLPDDLAAGLGLMIARVERAIRSLGELGRVHVSRWGDGSEHLHWWFTARPARFPQLYGTLVSIWDDVLPPVPEDVSREDVARLVAALS